MFTEKKIYYDQEVFRINTWFSTEKSMTYRRL